MPAYTGTGTGYFSTLEVRTVLSCLSVLDNPRQDIELASCLRSPVGNRVIKNYRDTEQER